MFYIFFHAGIFVFLAFPVCAACSTNLIIVDFIILIISGEEYRSGSCPLCNFLCPPAISSLLLPDVLLSSLFYKPPIFLLALHPTLVGFAAFPVS
jgi:hypothetical protein